MLNDAAAGIFHIPLMPSEQSNLQPVKIERGAILDQSESNVDLGEAVLSTFLDAAKYINHDFYNTTGLYLALPASPVETTGRRDMPNDKNKPAAQIAAARTELADKLSDL